MGFYQSTPSFDLGELHIENLFITDFLPLASGTFVKVYLMGLLFAKEENTQYRFDNIALANTLKLPIEDIHEAWNYWEDKKLIKKQYHEDNTTYDVLFMSLRELYILDNYISKSRAPSQSQLIRNEEFIKESEQSKKLLKQIEKITGSMLQPSDCRRIYDFQKHYFKNNEIIIRAFEYNYKERGIRNIKAIETLLRAWLDMGFSDLEQINNHILETNERFKVYKEVLKILGMSFRMANNAEKEAINRWIDDYGFNPSEIYLFITHFSKSTLNINFNYIEKRLSELKDKQIKEFEAFKGLASSEEAKKQAPKPSKKRQYTIEREKNYSEDELEALLLKRKPRLEK